MQQLASLRIATSKPLSTIRNLILLAAACAITISAQALGDSFLIGVVQVYFLLQHEQQFRTPVALQAFGDFLAGLNPRITERSQLPWIAFAGHDRPYDRLSGQPAYVADHVG